MTWTTECDDAVDAYEEKLAELRKTVAELEKQLASKDAQIAELSIAGAGLRICELLEQRRVSDDRIRVQDDTIAAMKSQWRHRD